MTRKSNSTANSIAEYAMNKAFELIATPAPILSPTLPVNVSEAIDDPLKISTWPVWIAFASAVGKSGHPLIITEWSELASVSHKEPSAAVYPAIAGIVSPVSCVHVISDLENCSIIPVVPINNKWSPAAFNLTLNPILVELFIEPKFPILNVSCKVYVGVDAWFERNTYASATEDVRLNVPILKYWPFVLLNETENPKLSRVDPVIGAEILSMVWIKFQLLSTFW